MHESKVGNSWLDEVIREAVRRALEGVMETEREAFLTELGSKKNRHYVVLQPTRHHLRGKRR